MKTKSGLFAMLLALCVWMSALPAQELGNKTTLGISLGAHKLLGGVTDKAMISGWGNLLLSHHFSEKIGLSLAAGAGWTFHADPDNPFKQIDVGPYKYFRTWLFPLHLNLEYFFARDGKFRPYVTLGGGVMIWQLRYERWTRDLFSPSGWNMHGTQYNPSGLGGLGFAYFISDRLLLDVSARGQYLVDQHLDNVGSSYNAQTARGDRFGNVVKVRTGDANNMVAELRVGLRFLFGAPKDSDGDGVIDRLDQCPHQPEDMDGFQDADGCPDLDNDGDGIPDIKDQCPNQAEDKDGYQDEDGCPDPDNDGDGIPDDKDLCPNQAEDFDGFQDEDGCPDPDNDGDGIPDDRDQCPNKPETVNGYQDEDGCPDEVPQKPRPLAEPGTPVVLPGVTFQTGKAELTPQAKLVLDRVFQILWENPEIQIEVRGYTDNVGSASVNQRLSQRRAEAVKTYLVKKGIAATRILAVGYGEENPIADNSTPEGRAKNRRIEFVRLK